MWTMVIPRLLGVILAGGVGMMLAAGTPWAWSSLAASPQPASTILQTIRGQQTTRVRQTTSGQALSLTRQLPSPAVSPAVPVRALLDQYCVTCHNERVKTANLMLDKQDVEHPGEGAAVWEKVVAKLRSGAMPPVGRPRPDKPTVDRLVSSLEGGLDRAAAANPNPGRVRAHRLNRTEYANVIRDLLALEIDGRAVLPADEISGAGFDNDADVLSVSPGLMERYLSAARQVARLAIGDLAIRPVVDIYKAAQLERQEDRVSEDLPFGTRGGVSVRRYFPLEGEYVITVRIMRTLGDHQIMRGFIRPNDIDVRLDGDRIAQFTVGGEGPAGQFGGTISADGEPIYSRRTMDTHFAHSFLAPGASIHHDASKDMTAVVIRLPIKAGLREVGATFLDKMLEPEGTQFRLPTASYAFQSNQIGQAMIEQLEIGGPYNIKGPGDGVASRQRIFVCRPTSDRDERACAKTILSRLARRAYRRPVTDEELQPLLSFYQTGRQDKGSFEAGIQSALVRLLVSPQFLFRSEREPGNVAPGAPHRISDVELASRLSFFLWSSIPDDELLDVAASGRLKDPAVLAQQVLRMVADRRSKTLVTSFVNQWFALRNLRSLTRDLQEFPDFDDNLREALQQETELFFESQIREDRPIGELLTANYTFLNERLASHYGIANIYGRHMRRVTLSDDRRRGLLGQGSILTVTSYPNRTSPVVRGKWVMENILDSPPPAPPPDVPPLDEQPATQFKTIRDRMEQHRKNPVCAACHARMDPLGFALENFDAVGQWRTHEGDTLIDSSGAVDGTKFSGVTELRQLLERREGEFITTVTKKLLTYALGRGVEYYDMPAVRQIVAQGAGNGYRWSSVILGIVQSTPFQMRRSQQ